MIIKTAFGNREKIPTKYTCDGENVNPPIEISEVPAGTKSLALVFDDPDAPVGIWVHWILFNIPADVKSIKENSVPAEARQGINDSKSLKYRGPCPPSGIHRYFLRIYALDCKLDLAEGSTKLDIERAMQGHIIEKNELFGVYERK